MTRDELVEKVARAMCATQGGPCRCIPCFSQHWHLPAIAAINLVVRECAKVAETLAAENRNEAEHRAEKHDFTGANHFNACADGCNDAATAILTLTEKKG